MGRWVSFLPLSACRMGCGRSKHFSFGQSLATKNLHVTTGFIKPTVLRAAAQAELDSRFHSMRLLYFAASRRSSDFVQGARRILTLLND